MHLGRSCLFALLALLLDSCGQSSSEPGSDNTASAQAAAKPDAVGWAYSVTPDDVTGKPRQVACVHSDDQVNLSFPYHPTTMRYCLRWRGGGIDSAWIAIDGKGQMMCGVGGCSFLTRWDDEAPKSLSMGSASDNDDAIMFFTHERKMLAATRAHHFLRVKVPFFENGEQNVTFDVLGLNPDPKAWPK